MLKSVLMWCMAMIVAVTLASCEKSQQEFAHEESPFVTEPVDFELPIEFDTRINYDPWGSYTFVSSTGYIKIILILDIMLGKFQDRGIIKTH